MRKNSGSEIRIANGDVGRVETILNELGAGSVLLVTHTAAYQNSGAEAKLEPFLSSRRVSRFTDFEPNPKLEDAERAVELAVNRPIPDSRFAMCQASHLAGRAINKITCLPDLSLELRVHSNRTSSVIMKTLMIHRSVFLAFGLTAFLAAADERGPAWVRHTIDNSSTGADGVRLADVNGDELPDIVTGWEEGGVVRVYLHPGFSKAEQKWTRVTVGHVGSVEDAVFADLDGDHAIDVVSSCEGRVKTMFVHWAPNVKSEYTVPEAWTTEPIPVTQDKMQWMFCLPMQVDGKHGVDLIAGGKGNNAELGWLEAPENPRNLKAWKWHPLCKVGWIMSIQTLDPDGDGDQDIVATDRRGGSRGCFWLENPGSAFNREQTWRRHEIGGGNSEVMFMENSDLDRDGVLDYLVAAKPREVRLFRQLKSGQTRRSHAISFPQNTGNAKAVNAGDIDLDGKTDLVITCEGATSPKSGVFWLSYPNTLMDPLWNPHEISGPVGVKYDLAELLDLDGDGDLDVLTCEERANLGVIWYENPAKDRL